MRQKRFVSDNKFLIEWLPDISVNFLDFFWCQIRNPRENFISNKVADCHRLLAGVQTIKIRRTICRVPDVDLNNTHPLQKRRVNFSNPIYSTLCVLRVEKADRSPIVFLEFFPIDRQSLATCSAHRSQDAAGNLHLPANHQRPNSFDADPPCKDEASNLR